MSKSLDEIGKAEKAAKAELEAAKKKFEAASPRTRLCNAIDNMLWTIYAYRSTPPTPEELTEYDRTYMPHIKRLMEEIKNEDAV